MGSIADFLADPKPKATQVADPALDSWLDIPRPEPTAKPDPFWDAIEAPPPPTGRHGTITYYPELVQGSDEWLAARCGLLTASEMKLIITPTLKVASNDKERRHLWQLMTQRITRYVAPHYINDDMLRGKEDEIEARILYDKHYAPVTEMGFITNDRFGFTLGFSPDGLVADDGFIECKSRRDDLQVEFITENLLEGVIPAEYIMQIQTGYLVSERKWCDFNSYSGGLHMVTMLVHPDHVIQEAILNAAGEFERRLAKKLERYNEAIASKARLIPTERRIVQEMYA